MRELQLLDQMSLGPEDALQPSVTCLESLDHQRLVVEMKKQNEMKAFETCLLVEKKKMVMITVVVEKTLY